MKKIRLIIIFTSFFVLLILLIYFIYIKFQNDDIEVGIVNNNKSQIVSNLVKSKVDGKEIINIYKNNSLSGKLSDVDLGQQIYDSDASSSSFMLLKLVNFCDNYYKDNGDKDLFVNKLIGEFLDLGDEDLDYIKKFEGDDFCNLDVFSKSVYGCSKFNRDFINLLVPFYIGKINTSNALSQLELIRSKYDSDNEKQILFFLGRVINGDIKDREGCFKN